MPATRSLVSAISRRTGKTSHRRSLSTPSWPTRSFFSANYKHLQLRDLRPAFRDMLTTLDELAEWTRMIGPDVQNVQNLHSGQMQGAASVRCAGSNFTG
jgi:hypothetical protein